MSHGYLSYFNKTCIISPGFFSHAITEFRQKHVSSETDCVFKKLNKTDEPSSCVWMGMTLRENQKKKD